MRNFINKFGLYIILAAAVAMSLALYFHFRKSHGSLSSNLAYFVDEDTNDESVHSASDYPPLVGKDGKPTVVIAVKVSCDGGKTSRIAFLEKYTPEAQAKLQSLAPDDLQRDSLMQRGLLIRLPASDSPWVPADSTEGANIRENVACPPGQTLTIVVPH